MKDKKSMVKQTSLILFILFAQIAVLSQTPSETPPPPADPPTVRIPEVKEKTLSNGLKVAVIQKRGLPLVRVSLIVKSGANVENDRSAGLANLTGDMLIKGTEFSSATEIAEEIEFLGASIGSGAGWNSSSVGVRVMKSGLGKALSIMSQSVIRPAFPEKELKLLKKQYLDAFNVSLKLPGSLLSYVSSRFSYGEHLASGTPNTINAITRKDIKEFHKKYYVPANSVLVITGDITAEQAFRYATLFFGGWKAGAPIETTGDKLSKPMSKGRMLVVDLPKSGQAAVGYSKKLDKGRKGDVFYAATVLNSILGSGYSARLNQEIRLKRGLSYGARSYFDWRSRDANFGASTQTKNESAAQVAELIKIEIEKLASHSVSVKEMTPRKAVVTGRFARALQTVSGLAGQLGSLYLYGISPSELNSYMNKANAVSNSDVQTFAARNLIGGDFIIVGDAKMFMEDLQKRFPNQTIEVVKAKDLNFDKPTLR